MSPVLLLYCPIMTYTRAPQVIFMTGWAPSSTTPRAAQRGSATVSFHEMAEALQAKGARAGRAQPQDADDEGGTGSGGGS